METKAGGYKYVCSIYDQRPQVCIEYPWNLANSIFVDCIFVDHEGEKPRLRTMEEQLEINSPEEISSYCVSCGSCCFFGPAACSKLKVIDANEDVNDR